MYCFNNHYGNRHSLRKFFFGGRDPQLRNTCIEADNGQFHKADQILCLGWSRLWIIFPDFLKIKLMLLQEFSINASIFLARSADTVMAWLLNWNCFEKKRWMCTKNMGVSLNEYADYNHHHPTYLMYPTYIIIDALHRILWKDLAKILTYSIYTNSNILYVVYIIALCNSWQGKEPRCTLKSQYHSPSFPLLIWNLSQGEVMRVQGWMFRTW